MSGTDTRTAPAVRGRDLDALFDALGDKTRRAILERVLERPRTIGELAEDHMKLSFAAVAKHVAVLEAAKLIVKKRDGPFRIVSANPKAISTASTYLEALERTWDARFAMLEELLNE